MEEMVIEGENWDKQGGRVCKICNGGASTMTIPLGDVF